VGPVAPSVRLIMEGSSVVAVGTALETRWCNHVTIDGTR
jgi:hypothetical protein